MKAKTAHAALPGTGKPHECPTCGRRLVDHAMPLRTDADVEDAVLRDLEALAMREGST